MAKGYIAPPRGQWDGKWVAIIERGMREEVIAGPGQPDPVAGRKPGFATREEAEAALRAAGADRIEVLMTRGPFALFDGARGPDGKVRVGVWDRVCVPGTDEKDGRSTRFDRETLSQMVDNFVERGDPIPIDYNHQSQHSARNGQPAPALAWYGALAIVLDGEIVKSAALPGVKAPLEGVDLSRPGLWAFRHEVTELGDQLLPNFKLLSPTFSPEGTRRDGSDCGYCLAAVAATNTPWQSGTAITFEGEVAMAYGLYAEGGGGKENVPASSDDDAIEQGKKYASAVGEGVQVWRDNRKIARVSARGEVQRFDVSMSLGPGSWSPTGESQKCPLCGSNAPIYKNAASGARGMYEHQKPGYTGPCPGPKPGEFSQFETGAANGATSNAGGAMTPEMLAKLGLSDGASPEEKEAAFAKYMSECEAKFAASAPPPPAAAMESDEDKAKMESDDKDKDDDKKKDADAAMSTMGATIKAMASKLERFEKLEAARAAEETKQREQKFEQLADRAIAGGYPKENRGALISFARSNFEGARATVAHFLPKTNAPDHIFDRMSNMGAPIGKEHEARSFAGAKKSTVVNTPFGKWDVSDAEFADEIERVADSKEPVTMERVNKLVAPHERGEKAARLIAAERIVRGDRPDLATSAE